VAGGVRLYTTSQPVSMTAEKGCLIIRTEIGG